MRRLAVLALCAFALGACGEDEELVPAAAQGKVINGLEAVRAVCTAEPGPRNFDAQLAGLVHVLRQYPDRLVQDGEQDRARPTSEVARRAAENLQRCGRPEAAAHVRGVLQAVE